MERIPMSILQRVVCASIVPVHKAGGQGSELKEDSKEEEEKRGKKRVRPKLMNIFIKPSHFSSRRVQGELRVR